MAPTWILLAALAMPTPTLAQETLQWWQTAVFYQIYPRSFMDSNGDGIGDLEGIRSKLDYIKSLGVGAVWLSPIYKSPMVDFGYDISDFRDIDPIFGTLAQFEELVKEAHEKGLKIVLDFVPNHTSDKHEWFIKGTNLSDPMFSKYRDYYVWHKGKNGGAQPPNNWRNQFGLEKDGDAWHKNDKVDAYYLHQFHVKQPDLNYRNPDVINEMKQVLNFWLDKGVDGFRVDAIIYLYEDKDFRDNPKDSKSMIANQPETYDMVAQWRQLLDNYTDKVMMVEAYCSTNETMKYFGNDTMQAAHFPFNFYLITDLNMSTFNARTLEENIHSWVDNVPKGRWHNWVIGNHDNPRVANRLGYENVDAMNMLVLLLPGTAITYYGEELGMENNLNITYKEGKDPQGCIAGEDNFTLKSRDFERTPFQWDDSQNAGFSVKQPWLPVNQDYLTVNVKMELQDPNSHLNVYKRLIQARSHSAIQHGNLVTKDIGESIFTFSRSYGNYTFIVVINLSYKSESLNLKNVFNLKKDFLSVFVANKAFDCPEGNVSVSNLKLPPHAAVVLRSVPDSEDQNNAAISLSPVGVLILGLCYALW